MSAYVIIEFTVKDPDVQRDKYGPIAGRMDARFSLLDGLPRPTEERASQ